MTNVAKLVVAITMACASVSARADVTIVEYFHSGFEHYFVTPVPDEIAKLDARVPPFELWSRTGRTFRAYESSAVRPGSVAICRFFNMTFAPKSSHFYAPHGLGCEDTVARFRDWQLEDDMLMSRQLDKLLGELSPSARAVMLLRYQEDLDVAEVGTALDMPVNTVKSHIKRSLTQLRSRMIGAKLVDSEAMP